MSQHDMTIADQAGAAFLGDLNSALAALFSNNSGATEPTTTVAYQFWADTTSGWLKQRNAANTGWEKRLPLAAARVDVASAATLDLDANAVTSDYVRITGTTTVTAVTRASGQRRFAVAGGAFQLTHGASLVLPGAVNYTTAAGDVLLFLGEAGGVVRVMIWKADGTAVVGSSGARGLFYKADPTAVAFTKTAAATASIKAGTKVDVAGTLVEFAAATAITMPALTAGTDYAIWVKDDATLQATTSFTSAPGAGNWRKIGGFHYAPGGNAAAQAGGDATPAINEYSLWDLKFRPACVDPRGMTLVADSFWADIYLLGVDHLTNGTSKYNVAIADGSSPPKIPTKFGGNGTAAYGSLTWWEANEVLQSWGKRSPTYDEFAALAYGTTEASSGGTDPASTILLQAYTSKWGAMLASGNMWIWGANFGGGAAGAGWAANTGGRGSTYQMENAVIFGGYWGETSNSGSRASAWTNSPTYSGNLVGARGVCDHLILD
jgi:hypothetical protein